MTKEPNGPEKGKEADAAHGEDEPWNVRQRSANRSFGDVSHTEPAGPDTQRVCGPEAPGAGGGGL